MFLSLFFFVSVPALSQKTKKVKGTAKYTLGLHDTPAKAIEECVKLARIDAIKNAFGEMVTSNTNMVDANLNGKEFSNFIEETSVLSRAEWLGDTKEPEIKQANVDGNIVFTATVWGEAREIKQAKVDFDWKVMRGTPNGMVEGYKFNNKDRIYITFRSPATGYLAIYLIDSTNKEANCLLPYKTYDNGPQVVKAGRKYTFFDKDVDPKAIGYNLTTNEPLEMDQIVVIFSPNQFFKRNENKGDWRHPNSLPMEDFDKWLRKIAGQDKDMVIDRSKYVQINNDKQQ